MFSSPACKLHTNVLRKTIRGPSQELFSCTLQSFTSLCNLNYKWTESTHTCTELYNMKHTAVCLCKQSLCLGTCVLHFSTETVKSSANACTPLPPGSFACEAFGGKASRAPSLCQSSSLAAGSDGGKASALNCSHSAADRLWPLPSSSPAATSCQPAPAYPGNQRKHSALI